MTDIQSQKVTDEPNENTIFMVWNFKDGMDVAPAFKRLCALVGNLNNSATNRFPQQKASVVLGISHGAWQRLDLPKPLPRELAEFAPIKGAKHTAVATRGDVHLHLRAEQQSVLYDMAAVLTDLLTPAADCAEEVHGFRYWDGRSILGFVDGTENPHDPAERAHFAIIGEEDAA